MSRNGNQNQGGGNYAAPSGEKKTETQPDDSGLPLIGEDDKPEGPGANGGIPADGAKNTEGGTDTPPTGENPPVAAPVAPGMDTPRSGGTPADGLNNMAGGAGVPATPLSEAAKAEGEGTTTMVFPKDVRLNNGRLFKAGVQEVPNSMKSHWYLKANGVTEHKK